MVLVQVSLAALEEVRTVAMVCGLLRVFVEAAAGGRRAAAAAAANVEEGVP